MLIREWEAVREVLGEVIGFDWVGNVLRHFLYESWEIIFCF
jgi:hypothetical protein